MLTPQKMSIQCSSKAALRSQPRSGATQVHNKTGQVQTQKLAKERKEKHQFYGKGISFVPNLVQPGWQSWRKNPDAVHPSGQCRNNCPGANCCPNAQHLFHLFSRNWRRIIRNQPAAPGTCFARSGILPSVHRAGDRRTGMLQNRGLKFSNLEFSRSGNICYHSLQQLFHLSFL